MRNLAMRGLLALLCCSILTACEADKNKPIPVTEVPVSKIVKPQVHRVDVTCPNEPVPGNIVTDVQLAKFNEDVRNAGADCRTKLKAVRSQVDIID